MTLADSATYQPVNQHPSLPAGSDYSGRRIREIKMAQRSPGCFGERTEDGLRREERVSSWCIVSGVFAMAFTPTGPFSWPAILIAEAAELLCTVGSGWACYHAKSEMEAYLENTKQKVIALVGGYDNLLKLPVITFSLKEPGPAFLACGRLSIESNSVTHNVMRLEEDGKTLGLVCRARVSDNNGNSYTRFIAYLFSNETFNSFNIKGCSNSLFPITVRVSITEEEGRWIQQLLAEA